MALRICLVSPFAWSQPHDVNDHVAGVAEALRARGHTVTVLAPSTRAEDIRGSRRQAPSWQGDGVIALGPAVPVSRRTTLGVPVGVRANLELALAAGGFDVVHAFEPALPSLAYLALRSTNALAVASFFSAERLQYPPGKAQREKLLARIDALVAGSEAVAEAAAKRFPGDYRVVSPGVDLDLFAPRPKEREIVLEWDPGDRPLARALMEELARLDGWRLRLLRTRPLTGRPTVPRPVRDRVSVETARDGAARAVALGTAAVVVPAARDGLRLAVEARAAGATVVHASARAGSASATAAEAGRAAREAGDLDAAAQTIRGNVRDEGFPSVARELEEIYQGLGGRRRAARLARARDEAEAEGDALIVCDLHMHTSWSHDCSTDVGELLDHAEEQGLGAIAITDHNRFGGALEAVERARGRRLIVIPGEEVKTDGQGEVIGLFLQEEIPRGMSFADTVRAIKEQGGLVYVPHPFDRRHAIPDPATLHRHLSDIDVFEVYNARLLFEGYNDEALRFARKYNLTMGAGSDAHVLPGVGTGAVRIRPFDGPEEFLHHMREAEILRRPKSIAYLQSLKWVAQVKEKVR